MSRSYQKSSIQSILLDKNYYTSKTAKNKVLSMGFEPLKFHETEQYYRFRIQNPKMFSKLRTTWIEDGMLFIVGVKQ